ncbi:MAG TPA: hypothetical protein VFF40_02835 [Acidimicrobiia bacterium]|nr:hypothetical protein [Acidimicrobiia bacterium]
MTVPTARPITQPQTATPTVSAAFATSSFRELRKTAFWRLKTTGVACPPSEAVSVRLNLELACAIGNGTVDELVADLAAERAEWATQRPALSTTAAPRPNPPPA